MFNHARMRDVLIIKDIEKETIYGVIGRMEVLLEYFQKEPVYHNLVPFLETYYLVTRASGSKYIMYKRYFRNMRDHEILDVYFASLYFKPLYIYLQSGEKRTPWKQYFTYCEKPHGIPFLQMLLGINAHINTDLYSSLVHLNYRHQSDFFLVNDILREVIPPIMQFLGVTKRDVIGMAGFVFKDFMLSEFHHVVERWRSEAWANAMLTTSRNKKVYYEKVAQRTEQIALELIEGFKQKNMIPNVIQSISNFNMLSAKI